MDKEFSIFIYNIHHPNLNPSSNVSILYQTQHIAYDNILTQDDLKRSKKDLCELDYDHSNDALNLIEINTIKSTFPRILCFVNTISINHYTKVQAIRNTWGQRCNKIIFTSNQTDEKINAIHIEAYSDHNHLWQKHKATLRYIWDTYGHEYDWFYKADDDAYVILENLKAYLRTPEIMQNYLIEPMQLGHRFSLTQELMDYYVVNKTISQHFQKRFKRWIFNSGGPGYAMNRLYIQYVIESIDKPSCLSDKFSITLPDDSSIAFCMAWYHNFPWNTRDLENKERFHPDKPIGTYYTNPNQPGYWFVQYHEGIGGLQWKEKCCSKDSIAFHYITPLHMYHLERNFYYCRMKYLTLEEYNKHTNLKISKHILHWEEYIKEKK